MVTGSVHLPMRLKLKSVTQCSRSFLNCFSIVQNILNVWGHNCVSVTSCLIVVLDLAKKRWLNQELSHYHHDHLHNYICSKFTKSVMFHNCSKSLKGVKTRSADIITMVMVTGALSLLWSSNQHFPSKILDIFRNWISSVKALSTFPRPAIGRSLLFVPRL